MATSFCRILLSNAAATVALQDDICSNSSRPPRPGNVGLADFQRKYSVFCNLWSARDLHEALDGAIECEYVRPRSLKITKRTMWSAYQAGDTNYVYICDCSSSGGQEERGKKRFPTELGAMESLLGSVA